MTTQTQAVPKVPVATPSSIPTPPPAREKRKFTVAEYYRMAEVGILRPDERVELIEGEILVMAPIGPEHSGSVNISNEIFHLLARGAVHRPRSEPPTPG